MEKKKTEKKRKDTLSQSITDESYIFFDELHILRLAQIG